MLWTYFKHVVIFKGKLCQNKSVWDTSILLLCEWVSLTPAYHKHNVEEDKPRGANVRPNSQGHVINQGHVVTHDLIKVSVQRRRQTHSSRVRPKQVSLQNKPNDWLILIND